MNFLTAAEKLNKGFALKRKDWSFEGYIIKDDKGRIRYFDHNEPAVYQPTIKDTLAEDWIEVDKDRWTVVSVSHDHELMKDKLFVTYQICSEQNGVVVNNAQIDEDELNKWSCYVDVDINRSEVFLNQQDVAQVKKALSA
ncbi:Thoeris anti-defense Tad2 family protein [Halobacillus mangrovi]|uniref:Thoeris anti-defense Tad2 family protein n=1 Tax=Halobacillus mangrovi TaxID=402384 RepID=UPI003D98D980